MSPDEIFKKVGVSNIKEFIEREFRLMNEARKKGLEFNCFQDLTSEESDFILPYVNEAYEKGIVKNNHLKLNRIN